LPDSHRQIRAAHDTSTITVAMMGYYLATPPEWQERPRAESRALGKVAIGYDDLESLPSIDLVFKETLRMYAPVGLVAREAIKDAQIDGRCIPKGTRLMLGIYATQRMEPWWNDPDTFDPSASRKTATRTPRTSTPGLRSAATSTNASACTSVGWKSKRSSRPRILPAHQGAKDGANAS
jgi:hypothetical protein